MAGESGNTESALELLRALEDTPWEYDFFHAVRRLEKNYPEKPRLGQGVKLSDEFLRLGQTPSLSFASSTLSNFAPPNQFRSTPKLEVNFQGLLGPNGPLPLHLTEYVYQRELHHGDKTLKNFLDIFHHRLLSLFYRAWANAEPACNADRDDDRFREYIGAFLGLSLQSMRHRDRLSDDTKLNNVGSFSSQQKSSELLANICSNFLGTKVLVREFVGHWMELPEDGYTKLTKDNNGCILGESAVLGANVWDRHSKFALEIGPLDYAEYKSMLPNTDRFGQLEDLVKNFSGFEFLWEARLILKRQEKPELNLDGSKGLGWDCWLGEPVNEDLCDLAMQS